MEEKLIFKHFHDHSSVTTVNPICTVYKKKKFLLILRTQPGIGDPGGFLQLMHPLGKKLQVYRSYSLANKSASDA